MAAAGSARWVNALLAATYLTLPPLVIVIAHHFTHVNFYGTLAISTVIMVVVLSLLLFLPFTTLHRFLERWRREVPRSDQARHR